MNAALALCQSYSSSITQDILRGWKIWTLPRLAPVKNKQLVVSDTVPRYRYSGYSVSKVNSSNQIEHMGRDKLKKPTRFKLRNSVKNLVWANSGNGGYSEKTQVKYSSKDLLVFLLHTDTLRDQDIPCIDTSWTYCGKNQNMWRMLIRGSVHAPDVIIQAQNRWVQIQGVFFFKWNPPKKLKYVKPRLGESTLT